MKREPTPLRPFHRGPCPKCGREEMGVRWCNGSIQHSVRLHPCPDWNSDHMHLTCPTCGYHTCCEPRTENP